MAGRQEPRRGRASAAAVRGGAAAPWHGAAARPPKGRLGTAEFGPVRRLRLRLAAPGRSRRTEREARPLGAQPLFASGAQSEPRPKVADRTLCLWAVRRSCLGRWPVPSGERCPACRAGQASTTSEPARRSVPGCTARRVARLSSRARAASNRRRVAPSRVRSYSWRVRPTRRLPPRRASRTSARSAGSSGRALRCGGAARGRSLLLTEAEGRPPRAPQRWRGTVCARRGCTPRRRASPNPTPTPTPRPSPSPNLSRGCTPRRACAPALHARSDHPYSR